MDPGCARWDLAQAKPHRGGMWWNSGKSIPRDLAAAGVAWQYLQHILLVLIPHFFPLVTFIPIKPAKLKTGEQNTPSLPTAHLRCKCTSHAWKKAAKLTAEKPEIGGGNGKSLPTASGMKKL